MTFGASLYEEHVSQNIETRTSWYESKLISKKKREELKFG